MNDGAAPQRHPTARRLITYALIVAGIGLTAYALGERLPGHAHTAADAGDTHVHSTSHGATDGTGMDMSHDHGSSAPDSTAAGMSHHHGGGGHAVEFVGASTTSGGYELVEEARDGTTASFHLHGPDGTAVNDYEWVHGAYLHVVMVRPDLSRFEHVHPEIDENGTWSVTAPDTGEWHVVFESTPAGAVAPVVVATHFDGSAETADTPLPPRSSTARVTTAGGTDLVIDLRTTETGLQFTITTAAGAPAEGLEAYLEQPAHLVAFRVDDLAYVHLHPTSAIGDPVITYEGSLPSGPTYRLFLQFAIDGGVVTVPYTFVP